MTDSSSLFSGASPLAARMRPRRIDDVVGQESLLRSGGVLWQLAQPVNKDAPRGTSVILYGPPGTGKTTIARAIAGSSGRQFEELSAISAGVKEVRAVIETAKFNFDSYSRSTILFLDEIHRFSKTQQDSLLGAVEAGWIILIAATTENPSFSVVAPLLSRATVLRLEPLDDAELLEVVRRAVESPNGLASRYSADKPVLEQLALLAGGDARRALTLLESAASLIEPGAPEEPAPITLESLQATLDRALVVYDRAGDQHYDVISAFIKSVRGSDADAAIHYLARMLEAGEDPRFVARRLVILAAEDIGLADPQALVIANAAADAVAFIGMPEGRIPLAEATIYLALAPKSNSAYNAINLAMDDVRAGISGPVPKPLRSSNYAGAKGLGNGIGYLYPHDDPRAVLEQQYLKGKTERREYYKPKDIGAERELRERWGRLRAIIRAFKTGK
jgi:putative ATPase